MWCRSVGEIDSIARDSRLGCHGLCRRMVWGMFALCLHPVRRGLSVLLDEMDRVAVRVGVAGKWPVERP